VFGDGGLIEERANISLFGSWTLRGVDLSNPRVGVLEEVSVAGCSLIRCWCVRWRLDGWY